MKNKIIIFLKKLVDLFSFETLNSLNKKLKKEEEELRVIQYELFFNKGMTNGLSRGLGISTPKLTFEEAYLNIIGKPLKSDENHFL